MGDDEGSEADLDGEGTPAFPREEVDEEFDSPVGIEEIKVEGAPTKIRTRAAPRPSVGAAQFDKLQNNAKRTLRGLRWFGWAARFGTLCNYLALPAAALLVALLFMGGAGANPWAAFGGLLLGLGAFVLFLLAAMSLLLAVIYSHLGRSELGVLQKREIVHSRHKLVRATIVGIGGAAVTIVLGLQAETPTRAPLLDYAIVYSTIAGLVTGALLASMFSSGLQHYLRNLAPRAGRRAQRRFRRYMLWAATPAIAFSLVGVPQIVLEYRQACEDLYGCPQDRLLGLAAPSYVPLSFLFNHPFFVSIQGLTLLVAAVLIFSRFSALVAMRTWRVQLDEAERLLMTKLRSSAPLVSGPAGTLPPEITASAE